VGVLVLVLAVMTTGKDAAHTSMQLGTAELTLVLLVDDRSSRRVTHIGLEVHFVDSQAGGGKCNVPVSAMR
jgi:hypothetical protein